MSRDELIAALQSRPCKPCGESEGTPRYRAVEAYHCTYCGYTVCSQCYMAIPTALLFPPRDGAGEAGRNVRPRLETKRRAAEVPTGDGEDFEKPRCHLCCTGTLVFESAPVHQWTCEGQLPERRLRPRAAYDIDYLQRYHTMKEQQKARSLCTGPLVAHFHGADASPNVFSHTNSAAPDRRPFCEEGGGFVFSVENPRGEQPCVWCAVTRVARESHAAMAGEETIAPLQTWLCPPSLPGLAERRFRVCVPYGAYALHGVHALALYLMDDIYRKAIPGVHMATAAPEKAPLFGTATSRPARLAACKKLPRSFVRPLLVVDVLHYVATADPIPRMLASSAGCGGRRETPKPRCQNENDPSGSAEEKAEESPAVWPGGLRCAELLLAVDHILHGRSVAVYGIASKHFFLHHVAQSAELRSHGIAVLDGYRLTASQVSRLLRDVAQRLQEQQRRAEHSASQRPLSLHLPNARRSAAPPRCVAETPPPPPPMAMAMAMAAAGAATPARSSASPARSHSYRTPVPERRDAPRRCATPPPATPAVRADPAGPAATAREPSTVLVREGGGPPPPATGHSPVVTGHSPVGGGPPPVGGAGGPRAWSRRHRLRDAATWGYSVPDWPPARQPRCVVASPDTAAALRRACRAPLQQCVAWLALPSATAQRVVPGAPLQLSGAALVLVVHGVDQLDPPALLELQALARGHTHRLVLLCSFDDPAWPASEGAAMLDAFRLAYVHLRSLLLPRVHEMAGINRLALLTDLEACTADTRRRNGFATSGNRTIGTLPMQDTIRRILFSLPTAFAELLRCMIEQQEKTGENVFIPMALHQEHFDECGMMVSMGRLKAIERELTSNRIAVFSAAENKLMIPQHRKLLKVLEEVTAQRQRGDDTSAAVEA